MSHRPASAYSFFRLIALMEFVLKNPCQQLYFSVHRVLPTELSPSYFPRFPFRPPCRHSHIAPSHRSSPQAISHGFPRSFPPELSSSYFTWFPFRPPCRHSSIAPSHRSSPQAISHGFPSVHPVVTPVSLLPTGALHKLFPFRPPCHHSRIAPFHWSSPQASYFTRFPFRPPSCRLRIAPSHRSSPQAISHGFPSVHPLASVSLLPTGALPKLFHTVSLPSTLSSLPYRSFPPELSPSYFTRFPFCPTCRHSRIAPSHRSSPQSISHGFPSVHPAITPASLLPTGALPKLFQTVSRPSTLSSFQYRSFPPELSPSYFTRFPFRPPSCRFRIAPSHRSSPPSYFTRFPFRPPCRLPYRSFPPELSPSYFPRFPFRPPCRHSGIAPSHGTLPKFPFRPPCHHSRIAPSHRSPPQAISHGFPSVHPVVIPVSLLPTGALPKLFHTVSLPSNLSSFQYCSFPPELSPSYFTRFPFRPPSCRFRIAPLQTGALLNLFHTVSLPSTLSSLPYRSFPPELSTSYFTRFPFRPPCRHSSIAPSHRSSPQAISHGFPSVHTIVTPVSLLPTGALPKLFPTVSFPSTQSLLPSVPSQRSSPHAISHGFLSLHPIVASIRSLPTELSPSYFPRFPLRPPFRHFRIAPSRQSA